ncbi:MAG: hypothetical protein CVT79_08265 [Alphaproteobacteria bacterium HGW-Alphaproteobacteria-18]|nr:MAG: hypothetical protein CVT79_08265 [Alphaproteobacteria bacterium HGW-Alphaproteobacteria-18]
MASATAIPNRPPAELYLGGAADESSRLVLSYAQARRQMMEPSGRVVRYFPHYRTMAALELARSVLADGHRLALIGHSWGADAALRVARQLEGDVVLIGADPVAKPAFPLSFLHGRPASARFVLHVDAVAAAPDRSDHVKAFGYLAGGGVHRAWREADLTIPTGLNHWNFAGMMCAKGPDGISAEDWLAGLVPA